MLAFTQTSESWECYIVHMGGQWETAEKERNNQSEKWSYKPNSHCGAKSILQINCHMRISMPFSSHAGALEEFLMRIKMANRYAMRKEKVQMRPKEGSVPKLQIFNMSILGIGRCGGELCHTIPCRPRELSTGLSRCLSGELFWDQKDNDSLPRAQLCSLNPFYHSMKSPWGPLS